MKNIKILTFFIVVGLCVFSPVRVDSRVNKIIGGVLTDNREFPWQVSIQTQRSSHVCGGVLITEKHILRAAHCVHGAKANTLKVKGGSKNGSVKRLIDLGRIESIFIHPNFDSDHVIANDIAIITLRNSVRFTSEIKSIQLPLTVSRSRSIAAEFAQMQELMTLSGWGMTTLPNRLPLPSDQLMKGQLRPVASSQHDYNN